MKFASALEEIISRGENPLRHALQNVTESNPIVIRKFGQVFSPHCLLHVSCNIDENGFKYGIGH
jgi:hypothetical protein